MRVPEWLSWTAGITSIAGLVVGVAGFAMALWAALSARSAKEAAVAARQAVHAAAAADEVLHLFRDAEMTAYALGQGDVAKARLIVPDIRARLSTWARRRARSVGMEFEPGIKPLQATLADLHSQLAEMPDTDIGPEDMARLREMASACVLRLADLLGAVQHRLDHSTGGGD